jgi:hypothetical protein
VNGAYVRIDRSPRIGSSAIVDRRVVDDVDRRAMIDVKFDGQKVLSAEWTNEGFVRTSFKPGPWEDALRRCDRMPALARPSGSLR